MFLNNKNIKLKEKESNAKTYYQKYFKKLFRRIILKNGMF